MILFYSEYCDHCNLLLETIKRHDSDGVIKLISIDLLRNLKKKIDSRIHSVPALMFPNTKEIIFGKQVFDYLLLPNRGILFANKITRDKTDEDKININLKINTETNTDEPLAFSLGSIVSENYASINDDDNNSLNTINNKNYRWTTIIDNDTSHNTLNNVQVTPNNQQNIEKKKSNSSTLPTIEEIMQAREKDIR